MIGKLLLAAAAVWLVRSVPGTAKSRNTEDRLNQAMPRIPWPQPYDGPAGNSSYPPGNNSYTSGNYSYPINYGDDRIGQADQSSVTGPTIYDVSGWYAGTGAHNHTIDHAHDMPHGHIYGSLATDFNNLRNAYSDTVSAFNNHIGDYGALVTAVQVLRADHSNLLNNHNGLMFRLNAANILQ